MVARTRRQDAAAVGSGLQGTVARVRAVDSHVEADLHHSIRVIPLGDDNSRRRTVPWVTYALVAANLWVFLVLARATPEHQLELYARFAAVPADVVGHPSAWPTLLTCTFLHASWAHVLGNLLYLWVFGDNVEDAMGHGRYVAFYLLCGVAASLSQVLVDPASTVPLVGASGAIAGVLAAYVVVFPHGGVRTLIVIVPPFFLIRFLPAWLLIGVWAGLQFFSAVTALGGTAAGGVAYLAHVGGFVVGLLACRAFRRRGGVDHRVRAIDAGRPPARW